MIPGCIASKCTLVRGGGSAVTAAQRLSGFGAVRNIKIATARPVNDGRQVDVEFADKTAYRFPAAVIKDAHPGLYLGRDFLQARRFESDKYTAERAEASSDGSRLRVHFNMFSENVISREYGATWLHASASHIGQPIARLEGRSEAPCPRKGWGHDLRMPSFKCRDLMDDARLQEEFLAIMADTGVALITDMGERNELVAGLSGSKASVPMENLVGRIMGRLKQDHPSISHSTQMDSSPIEDCGSAGHRRKRGGEFVSKRSSDYLHFKYQATGSISSKVCDGLALANYMKDHHPECFHLLTTVPLQDGCRGTEPVIKLDQNGQLEKVVQAKAENWLFALPFHIYGRYMEAYRRWSEVAEDPRFACNFNWPEHSMIAMNSWRVLHGAQMPVSTQRTMTFGSAIRF